MRARVHVHGGGGGGGAVALRLLHLRPSAPQHAGNVRPSRRATTVLPLPHVCAGHRQRGGAGAEDGCGGNEGAPAQHGWPAAAACSYVLRVDPALTAMQCAIVWEQAKLPLPPALLQVWLSTTGSPHSVIERCDFSNEREVESLEYSTFAPRRRH